MERHPLIVLDTHAWVWWTASPERLSAGAGRAIENAGRILVPAISCWEVAMLVQKDRLELDRPVLVWIRQALGLGRVELAEVSPEIACLAAALSDAFPGDPADRLIAATAIRHRAVLVTKDSRIRGSRVTATLW